LLGEMMAKTSKSQTYNDVINALTVQSVIIPAELLENIDAAINANKQLGYATREEFVEDAIVGILQNLSGKRKKENASKELKSKKTE
jgi:metal-responsive CopG/Arc/MetJ family transcriptional regulator